MVDPRRFPVTHVIELPRWLGIALLLLLLAIAAIGVAGVFRMC